VRKLKAISSEYGLKILESRGHLGNAAFPKGTKTVKISAGPSNMTFGDNKK
jgi:hypothetical protein